jgi:hypothetical protein
MNPGERSVVREGIVAGLIGAAVVALWFFVFDLMRGRPFITPTLLGSMVFFGVKTPVGLEPALGPILGYTVLHGLAFIAFGIVAATMMAMSEREPTLFIGFVILFACFEVFFFGLLSVLGRAAQAALVWWSVLIGNLLASMAMIWYFFRRYHTLPKTLIGSWGGVLREGVVAGIIGAAVVAVWFFAIDAIHGEPLHTPRVLGSIFLQKPETMQALVIYTVLHGILFIAFGIVGALVMAGAERYPMLIFGLVILFAAFEVGFFGGIVIVASWVLDELAGWTIFVGNILAAVSMLAYYFVQHRALRQRLSHSWAEEEQ